jgi:putative ABC transport system permease protein
VLYRIILQAAYQIDMPSYTVKLISALIVAISLTLPLIREKFDAVQMRRSGEGRVNR